MTNKTNFEYDVQNGKFDVGFYIFFLVAMFSILPCFFKHLFWPLQTATNAFMALYKYKQKLFPFSFKNVLTFFCYIM